MAKIGKIIVETEADADSVRYLMGSLLVYFDLSVEEQEERGTGDGGDEATRGTAKPSSPLGSGGLFFSSKRR
jgi:hypothetical protein